LDGHRRGDECVGYREDRQEGEVKRRAVAGYLQSDERKEEWWEKRRGLKRTTRALLFVVTVTLATRGENYPGTHYHEVKMRETIRVGSIR
jgi:hypothetical protein